MLTNSEEVFDNWAEAYDFIQRRTERGFTEDIPFYKQQADNVDGKILDIGCGTGRIYLELLEEGNDIRGIDSSKNALEILRSRAEKQDLDPQVHCANMQDFDIDEEFDLIIVPFNTFSYNTSREEQFQCLQQIKDHLVEDGKAVIDMPFPRMREGTFASEFSIDGSEYFLVQEYELDIVNRVKNIDRRLFKDGEEVGSIYCGYARIFKNEFIHLIQRVGFEDWNLYGDFNCGSLESDSESLVWEIFPSSPSSCE